MSVKKKVEKRKLTEAEIAERKSRIIARGEFSDHCHIVEGNVTVKQKDGKTLICVEDGVAVMRHLLESKYLKGEDVWTGEHKDMKLSDDVNRHGDVVLKKISGKGAKKVFEYIPSKEHDPYKNIIRRVYD